MANYKITFSPTGGTKKVADIIAEGMGGSWKDIELCIAENDLKLPVLTSEDICLLAVPSFGGRVPEVNVERIRKICGNGAKAILLCVYGNREYEDTLTELQDETESAGFNCIAAVSAIAEHSIARQFAAGRPDEKDSEILKGFALKIREKLEANDLELHCTIPGSHNTYKERGRAAVPETNDNCVECGICAKGCPVGAIDFDNPKITNSENCISCMKCISICPVGAKVLNENVLSAVSERLRPLCSDRKENKLFI